MQAATQGDLRHGAVSIGAKETDEEMTELKPLSKKHQRVLDEYLLRFNQWQAYKAVYPKVTDESARTLSSKLFADVHFSAHLEARLAEVHMSADEALRLMADIARGDIGDLMDITSMGGMINLKRAQELGLTKLIKKVKQKTVTKLGKKEDDEDVEIHDLELELYPADAALERILKITGKYKDTSEFPKELILRVVKASDEDSS
jgi:hypothetical protein